MLNGPIIDVANLSVHRGGRTVRQTGTAPSGGRQILHDVSFQMNAGEFLCVTGPNGAGKTTLLQCLLRLLDASAGYICIAGHDIRHYSRRELAKQVSYVPQTDGRSPAFSVEDFVLLGRYPHRRGIFTETENDRRVALDALEMTGTAAFAQRALSTLSGGERQKVFIAAALAQEAPILLLDEPTVFLDPRHQSEISVLLRRLSRERGATIVLVTHDIHLVSLCADKVLALSDGRAAYFGPAPEFIRPETLEILYGIPFDVHRSPSGTAFAFHRNPS